MTALWQSLEEVAGLMDVADGWRRRLGTEFEPLRRFLRVTDKVTGRYDVVGQRDPWRVIEDAGQFVAVCRETTEHRIMERRDVALHRFDVRRLASEIAEAMSIKADVEVLGTTQHIVRVGKLPADLQSRPVWLCIRKTHQDVARAMQEILLHESEPFLVLHPTGNRITPQTRRLLGQFDSEIVALKNLVRFDAAHKLITTNRWKIVVAGALKIELAAEVPLCQFRRDDDFWWVAFNTKPRPVKDSTGMPYIACLLMRPNEVLTAMHLEALESGLHELTRTGTRGEQTDKETLRDSHERLKAIANELDDAIEFNDVAAITALQTEREDILGYVNKATGLAGNIKDNADAKRSGDSVSRAIRRAFTEIDKKCPEAAEHLRTHIQTGIDLLYSPPEVTDWHL
ncbi:hypothetical protein Pla22_38510 [Rubripirellula amarantea]|uniref:Uncharacterized protein n=1 Tax=Rubripirellula amarantea TaxID=2527999 RepID=A0A5C5WLM7_9BACT|nr:hypothetical protein [Rubripirellula amarantea]TWT51075.1 hypothetical protein Pla22_38510 [Rubripirellula amarantea]